MRSRFMFAAAVLCIAVLVGWSVNTITGEVTTVQRNAGDITLVECEAGSRANVSRAAFSIGRVVCGTLPSPTSTSSSTPTRSATETPTIATSTPTPTAFSSATGTPTATNTPPSSSTPSGTDACSQNPDCGLTPALCDTWVGGWCDDGRQYGATIFEMPYPNQIATATCLDTSRPDYLPTMLGGALPFPCWFTKYRHVMSRVESGSFGVAMLRYHRPVDLSAERHIHLEADMKGRTRNYFRVLLSPDLTLRDSDDRAGNPYPRSFIQFWFRNGNVEGVICRDLVCDGNPSYPFGSGAAFGSLRSWEPVFSPDNVRVPIDIYLSRTSARVYINGIFKANATFAPLNFDKAYLTISQASYNPCKDGQCSVADQITHWDGVSVDGPTLAPNSLTPIGYRDYVWNSYAASACAIGGYPAQVMGVAQPYTWVTWVARVPSIVTLTRANIACTDLGGYSLAGEQHRGFQVVEQMP